MQRHWVYALMLSSLLYNPALAIVIRHDVADERYHASMAEFPALATFYTNGGHGVLIAPRWVLTAAHATYCLQRGSMIRVRHQPVTVSGIYIHPDYRPNDSHDIALVRLRAAVADTQPASLYRLADEEGMNVWLTGIGGTGNGKTGQMQANIASQGELRKAQNQITDTRPNLLMALFDEGQRALPLEGVTGSGDGGGPVYVSDGDRFQVVGISSRFKGEAPGLYGVRDIYTRVSAFAPWIESVVQARPEVIEELADTRLHSLPGGLKRRELAAVCTDISLAERY
ncbi:trypsin-like serine protease [Alteromonas sp. ASW11-19]|uniref:Trypsin-like serine protease n=1 Tax=Alteromonas salexigens TaxID=2982530 RepID=A0ABT2VPR3_9ALTE|nr:trypsin-like serine protease [Alteromonas salexigens]MCU7555305.1 trypsin-like serine protease [Alteromonas salexigens]